MKTITRIALAFLVVGLSLWFVAYSTRNAIDRGYYGNGVGNERN